MELTNEVAETAKEPAWKSSPATGMDVREGN